MLKPEQLDDLIKRLTDAVPPVFHNLRADLAKNFRSILQATFVKLDLVTREEFDVQVTVLTRLREKLEALEKQLAELEQQ
ncbi:MAG: accessory factor UbiK family protein [Gammaproteobacteria bacterium]